jgi:hypothetical protein
LKTPLISIFGFFEKRFLRRVNGKNKLYIKDDKRRVVAPGQATSLAPMSYEGSLVANNYDGNSGSKYVLLQMLKADDPRAAFIPQAEHAAAGGGAIVKIIPVGDWYSFQKPSVMKGDKSLKEIEADYIVQEKRNKAKVQKLKKIQDGTDLEDQAAVRRKIEAKIKQESLKAPSLFGNLKQKRGNAFKKSNDFRGHLTEDGAEADGGDGGEGEHYEEDNDADFTLWDQGEDADDEEEYVEVNQAKDNELEELEAARLNAPLNADDDDYIDSDTENEDEEEEDDEDSKRKAGKGDSSHYGKGSEFALAAAQLASALRNRESHQSGADSGSASGSDSGSEGVSGGARGGRNSLRRSREEMSASGDEEPLTRVESFSSDTVVAKRAKVESTFNEENVKSLIFSKLGGRIKANELMQAFKKDAKRQYGENYKGVFAKMCERILLKSTDPITQEVYLMVKK